MENTKRKRKYTVGGLEIRPLSVTDVLWTIPLAFAVGLYRIFVIYCPCNVFTTGMVIAVAVGFQTISSPFGIRFRSVYFSLIWVCIALFFIDIKNPLSYYILVTFMLYHVLRLVFYRRYSREFIPYQVVKGDMWPHHSRIEGRSSTIQDKRFTLILVITGFALFLLLVILVENIGSTLQTLPCGICEDIGR